MTSPPYCNRYDYTRTYALELAMLDLTQAEVLSLRQEMLSCTVENREKNLLKICPHWESFVEAANQQKLLQTICTYLEHEKASGTLNNSGIPRLDCTPDEINRETYRMPEKFIAFGELKGGIDPAGADEHWKTAQTALMRIRTAFASHNLSPDLFFIGAVIADSMAEEIWNQLEDGTLKNAANLTSPDQVASLSNWLVAL